MTHSCEREYGLPGRTVQTMSELDSTDIKPLTLDTFDLHQLAGLGKRLYKQGRLQHNRY